MNKQLQTILLLLLSFSSLGQICSERIIFALPQPFGKTDISTIDNLKKDLKNYSKNNISIIKYGLRPDIRQMTLAMPTAGEYYSHYFSDNKATIIKSYLWKDSNNEEANLKNILEIDNGGQRNYLNSSIWPLITDLFNTLDACEKVIVVDFYPEPSNIDPTIKTEAIRNRELFLSSNFQTKIIKRSEKYQIYAIDGGEIDNTKQQQINLNQNSFSWLDNQFVVEPTTINLSGTLPLEYIDEVYLTISSVFNDSSITILKDNIKVASLNEGQLISSDGKMFGYDKKNLTVSIPSLSLELDKSKWKNAQNLAFSFKVKGAFDLKTDGKENRIKWLTVANLKTGYIAQININNQGAWTIGLSIAGLLLLIGLITFYFKYLNGNNSERLFIYFLPSDSKEVVDYKSSIGRQRVGYIVMDGKTGTLETHISLTSDAKFGKSRNVVVKIEPIGKVPDGYTVRLKDLEDGSRHSFWSEIPLNIKLNETKKLLIEVQQITDNPNDTPIFEVSMVVTAGKLSTTEPYIFSLGSPLSDVWMAFDAGTTGSCLAVSDSTDNIIPYIELGSPIIPSIIAFNKKQKYNGNKETLEYLVGNEAKSFLIDKDYYTFQSIKKLLGYTDPIEITINANTYETKGQELSEKLIGRLYQNFKKQLKEDPRNAHLTQANRAIVAIPNHFVANNIQDLLDCFQNIGFQEVRFIHEAEAIAYYAYQTKKISLENPKTILIFDMGGGTINATLLRFSKDNNNYTLNNIDRVGYRIGGDTIDYYIIKTLERFSERFENLGIQPFSPQTKNNWSIIAREIKHIIVEKNSIEPYEFTRAFQLGFPNSRILLNDSSLAGIYVGFMTLFERTLEEKVLNEINTISQDITAGGENINYVILSGRSTAYQKIQQRVKAILSKTTIEYIILPIQEAKIAVAYGCCWYAIMKDSIKRNKPRTHANYGIGYIKDGTTDKEFINIIEKGSQFPTDTNKYIDLENINIDNRFISDNRYINFYQINTNHPQEAFRKQEKHKFNLIAKLKIVTSAKTVEIKIDKNDNIKCTAVKIDNLPVVAYGHIQNTEIGLADENEEHFTWMTK